MNYADFLSLRVSGKVQKIAVNAGLTCPNRDGTLGWGGCSYCDNSAFNPSYCDPALSVAKQIELGKQFFGGKYPDMRYLAYFQAYTGTHAPFSKLQQLYDEALSVDDVVGIVIATRPDCVSDQLLDYLQELNSRALVIVELGVETIHDRTLQLINRCHDWATSRLTINRIAARGIAVGVHLILGLPGESDEDMIETVTEISRLPVKLVKFHQLQVLRGTPLDFQVKYGLIEVRDWNIEEYARLCAILSKCLRHDIVVERWLAQAPPYRVVTPRWGMKPARFNQLLTEHMKHLS